MFRIPEIYFFLYWFLCKAQNHSLQFWSGFKKRLISYGKGQQLEASQVLWSCPRSAYKSQDCTGNLLLLHFSSNSNHDICIWQTQRYFSTIVPNLYNSQLPTASCSTFHSVEHISGLLNLDVRWSPSRQELWREGHALDSQLGHSFQDLASSIFFFF